MNEKETIKMVMAKIGLGLPISLGEAAVTIMCGTDAEVKLVKKYLDEQKV